MLACGTEHDRARLGSSVTIDGDELEVVDEFVCLGSLVTYWQRIINGSRLLRAPQASAVEQTKPSYKLYPVQNAYKTGCSLRARTADVKNHLRRRALGWCMVAKDEP